MNGKSISSLTKLPAKITFIPRCPEMLGLNVIGHSLSGGSLVVTNFTQKTSSFILNKVV